MEHVFDSKENFQKKCFAEKSESLSYLVLQQHIMSDQHHKVQRHMKRKDIFQADWSTQVFLQTLVGQGQVMIVLLRGFYEGEKTFTSRDM